MLLPDIATYERLLKEAWYINTVGVDGENALTAALSQNHEAARFLLARGAAVSRMALNIAVDGTDPEFFRRLMNARKLDLNSEEARTLLVDAARRSTAIMRLLLESGVDPNTPGNVGETPLEAAVSNSSWERIRLLLASGAAARRSADVMAAAVRQNQTGLITLLAQHGANVNAQDSSGQTPLMVASDLCRYWHIPSLLEVGADLRLTDKKGRTALQPETAIVGRTESCDKSLAVLQDAIRNPRKP